MCCITYLNWMTFHWIGFHTGTGRRRMGSICPNRIAITTYSGNTNSKVTQAMPGSASAGQISRDPRRDARSATCLELLPDLVPLPVHGRWELEQVHTVGEVPRQDG